MNVESELLWPAVVLLLLLGMVASLCVRCSRLGKGVSGDGSGVPSPGCSPKAVGQVSQGKEEAPKPPMKTVGLAHGGLWFCWGWGMFWKNGGGAAGLPAAPTFSRLCSPDSRYPVHDAWPTGVGGPAPHPRPAQGTGEPRGGGTSDLSSHPSLGSLANLGLFLQR